MTYFSDLVESMCPYCVIITLGLTPDCGLVVSQTSHCVIKWKNPDWPPQFWLCEEW